MQTIFNDLVSIIAYSYTTGDTNVMHSAWFDWISMAGKAESGMSFDAFSERTSYDVLSYSRKY